MSFLDKVIEFFKDDLTLVRLVKVILLLSIIYLMMLTSEFWTSLTGYFFKIFKPFIIGFLVAYIIHPFIESLEEKGLNRNFAIPVTILMFLAFFTWLSISVFPLFYNEMGSFINSIIDSVQTLYEWYLQNVDNPSQIINNVLKDLTGFLSNIQTDIFGNITNFLSRFISSSLSFLSTVTFSLVVTIYVLLDYSSLTQSILRLSGKFHHDLPDYLQAVDKVLSTYIHSTFILMAVRFFEYSIFYYLVGHKGFLIMGLLYAIGVLVPYFGGIAANIIGIFTFLTMPRQNMIALIIGIVVLSTADGYLISPLVYSKTSDVEPLWSLLSVFIGSALFGPIGIMIAVPAYMSIRQIRVVYNYKKGASQ